jgi:glutamate synthase (NADPH/NADH) small chain
VSEKKSGRKGSDPREEMPRQDPKVRRTNFDEVALGYSADQAVAEAQRCLYCKKPFCVGGCPVEIDIPAFVRTIAEKDFAGAALKIKEKNALPAICGRVCPQEDQCEKYCVLGKKWEPLAIGRLERFAADWEAEHGEISIPETAPPTGKKVGVVGSGPAGLTVAADLAMLGHGVTVFEALHAPGGVLVYGIPEFRLPKRIVAREVEFIEKLGVEVEVNFVVGKTRTIDELIKEQGYNAIFIATGAGLPYFMGIPGENLNGVYSANEFLTRSNLMKAFRFPDYDTPVKVGKKVAVVGGGNVAMDSVRTAMRLGAVEVYCVYRRSRAEMPAREEEIENALEEEMILKELHSPVRIIGDDRGWVEQMECIKMELGEPDASSRRRPVPIEGSEFLIDVDVVVIAIGQGPNPLVPSTTPGLETNKWGNIIAEDETGLTSLEGVYAGGDIVTGAATVILAMGAGRKAARAIHAYLGTG